MKSQDSNEVLAIQAFESFNNQDYKTAIQNLQKLKLPEKDKNYSRLLHNQYLCEFLINRSQNQVEFVKKLEMLLQSSLYQKQEKDEQLLLKYNFCVLLYGYQKFDQLMGVLQDYFEKKEPINDLIQLKLVFLFTEVCIQCDQIDRAVEIINMLEDQKHYIMSVFSQIPCEDKKIEKKQNLFTSVFFASEINRHEEPVSLVNRYEFNLILSYFRIQIFSKINELSSAKQSFKFMKQQLNMLLQVVQQNVTEKNLIKTKQTNNVSHQQDFLSHISLYLIKFYGNFYKYHKSFINYKEKNYRKAVFILQPSFQFKLSCFMKDNHQMNMLHFSYFMNNLACISYQQGKYNLALMYWQRALNYNPKQNNQNNGKLDQITINTIQQKTPIIIQNMANVLYYLKKYNQAIELFQQITEVFPNSQHIWYKMGICYMNLYHESLKTNKKQNHNVYNDVIENQGVVYKNNSKKSLFKRYVLYPNSDPQNNTNLEASIRCFQNSLLLSQNQEKKQVVLYLDDLDDDEKEDKKELKDRQGKTINIQEKIGVKVSSLICLAYLHLCSNQMTNGNDFNQPQSIVRMLWNKN